MGSLKIPSTLLSREAVTHFTQGSGSSGGKWSSSRPAPHATGLGGKLLPHGSLHQSPVTGHWGIPGGAAIQSNAGESLSNPILMNSGERCPDSRYP